MVRDRGFCTTSSHKSKFKRHLLSFLTGEQVNEPKLEMFQVGEADPYRQAALLPLTSPSPKTRRLRPPFILIVVLKIESLFHH